MNCGIFKEQNAGSANEGTIAMASTGTLIKDLLRKETIQLVAEK